ncbi:uncharacterized protein LOC127259071 [Andrographis paniculata]|uniref:uncharacterized protein LOC127259071 n=1 Tax=Andrographis paniculata TaxID=175694 RepID=UPI0021E76A4C|nr:uncharacterized protein LOC127259071 [Andrographis paniculata]
MLSKRSTPIALLLGLVLSAVAVAVGGGTADSASAYEVLQSYNFPVGILPKGVTGYDLDASSGSFNAYMNGSCSFSLEGSYRLSYGSKISGTIYRNRLSNLSGVSVKVFFVWLKIVEVRRNGDDLDFSVGIASAQFSIDNFFVSPQCGCGLNCNNSLDGEGEGEGVGVGVGVGDRIEGEDLISDS